MRFGLLLLTLLCQSVLAAEDYVLEIGAGLVAGQIPVYPGAADDYDFILPFPYFYYEDKNLKLERNALAGNLLDKGPWRLRITGSGALPVREDKSSAREGMPELGWVGHLGPQIEYQLSDAASVQWRVHKAVAWDDKLQSIGWLSELALGWGSDLAIRRGTLRLESQLSANFASAAHQDYYYGVSDQYVRVERPDYEARSGLAHLGLSVGLTWRYRQWWVGAYAKYYNLTHAANLDSPLLEETDQVNAGIAIAWILWNNQ